MKLDELYNCNSFIGSVMKLSELRWEITDDYTMQHFQQRILACLAKLCSLHKLVRMGENDRLPCKINFVE